MTLLLVMMHVVFFAGVDVVYVDAVLVSVVSLLFVVFCGWC